MKIKNPKITLLSFILLSASYAYSQNLIRNPSFEDYLITGYSSDDTIWYNPYQPKYWQAVYGSVDYYYDNFKTPNENLSSLNRPFINNSTDFGDFFIAHIPSLEMIKGELTHPLIKDSIYELSFFTQCSNFNTNRRPTEIGILISSTNYYLNKKNEWDILSFTKNQLSTIKNEMNIIKVQYLNANEWVNVTYRYKAKGGEIYIYLYHPWIKTKHQKKKKMQDFKDDNFPYIAYDNFCLYKSGTDCLNINKKLNEEKNNKFINRTYIFYFQVDSCSVEFKTYEFEFILQELYSDSGKIQSIEVFGNSDNIGDSIKNISLSLCRAMFIKSKLVNMGINDSLINCFGNGSSQPIDRNDTEKGRQKNRRVELIIIRNE